MKTLYFEGAGWSGADISKATIGNCRIRTAFHLDDGKAVYLELIGSERTKNSSPEIYCWPYTGFVSHCYYITDDIPNDDCNKHSLHKRFMKVIAILEEPVYGRTGRLLKKKRKDSQYTSVTFPYTEEGVLELVNSLGASFDAIKVLPDLGGYQVFPKAKSCQGLDGYYYGDEFQYDPELVARREIVYQHHYELEESEGKEYPNFSLWVDEFDPGLLHLLRHFNGYNKHWAIRTDVGDKLEDWMATAKETPLGRYGC